MTTSHDAPMTEGRRTERVATRERNYAFAANRAGARAENWSADDWREHSRIVLTPVAAPSILGLFGFFFATLIVGTNMAGWWGTAADMVAVFPVAIFLGGVAQFLAGMWSYKARDGAAGPRR